MREYPIYFDNAATTFPKPPSVVRRTVQFLCREGGNPGRGSHTMALRAADAVYRCRERAADFFSASGAERVVFTQNTTYALNTALKSVLRPGDHVITGNMEHNSVMRPLYRMERQNGVTTSVFDMRMPPQQILACLASTIRPNTRALVCAHMPNTANFALPLREVGEFCRRHGILFIADGAQSAGILPIRVKEMGIDILCVPGHKGLYGPQGCGMMILGESCPIGATLTEGGSGMHSFEETMPEELPEHFEAGTLPSPAIAGLEAGIAWVEERGIDRIRAHECALWRRVYEGLLSFSRIHIADSTPGPILLFTARGIPPTALAAELDHRGICVRAGYHCAPSGHRVLGTDQEGAVRLSFGAMNTEAECDTFLCAMREILP